MRVLSVFGTRPEAVKMAPVIQALAQIPGIKSRVCVTAQHREILDQVLDLFKIVPDYDLNVMEQNQTLADISRHLFEKLDPILAEYQPDWVLVQGDTTTVAVTALMSYYRRIRLGHVEAGLRTGDKWQPFPEEINRRVAGIIADLHFAPTGWARDTLINEGVPQRRIIVTGNPVIDALQVVSSQPPDQEVSNLLASLGISPKGSQEKRQRLLLVTAHRRENFGKPLEGICEALKLLAKRGDVEIIYPVHPNPNVRETVHRLLKGISHITLLPPVNYLPMVQLMKNAFLVLTDSGGIQEEAPFFGVPVLVMRDVTERPEGVEAGVLKLVGTESQVITQEASRLLDDSSLYGSMSKAVNPFGDGRAAPRIVQALIECPLEK